MFCIPGWTLDYLYIWNDFLDKYWDSLKCMLSVKSLREIWYLINTRPTLHIHIDYHEVSSPLSVSWDESFWMSKCHDFLEVPVELVCKWKPEIFMNQPPGDWWALVSNWWVLPSCLSPLLKKKKDKLTFNSECVDLLHHKYSTS